METDNTARLFPGFEDRWIDLESTRIFTRTGGPDGAPVVLLIHGFPQSHLCWHPIAADLAKTHRVVCLDLKGYGRSATPSGDRAHREYSKRMWARECVAAMSELGHDRFAVVGHDRGAQVAYRMALDSPERIGKLAILDNLPIHIVWELIDANPGYLPWWEMMARPAPEPENIMTADYIEELVAGASATQSVDIFHPAVLEEYRRNWADPSHVHAYCEDYRAGAGPDVIADKDDIDKSMMMGTGVPMGPLILADYIGLDTCLAIMQVLHTELGDSKYRPAPLLQEYVDAGRLGRKTKHGFHDYNKK